MTPERWQRIKTILADAREVPLQRRPQWLVQACGGDDTLQLDVAAFLEHEDELEGFIDVPVLALTTDVLDDAERMASDGGSGAETRMIGRVIGPYRLVRLLGEGGMGAVFEAERVSGFEQRLALKLIRPGLASPVMLRRFEDERQILARLEHPNIARLLDGGTSEDGAPFFAMELIDGVPIDRYCDERRLTTGERIALFLPVCSALAEAHQNLVIHRDLKPGNILVDAAGTPKLLDFGIAKLLALDPGVAGPPVAEATYHQIMTPRYASPEQLRNGSVGTASDVYALGVVLYQVLTGHLPCRLEQHDPVAAIQAVCEEEPLPASVVVQRTAEITSGTGGVVERTPAAVSRVRDGDLRTLRHRLSGDIDAILAKALRKEPQDRYRSVVELADDLCRHRDGLPVSARQGSKRYRAMKFIRRHRLGLASATTVVVVALAFTIALAHQLRVTERARDRAEEMSTFLIELFQAAAPDQLAGQEPTVRDLLDRGLSKLEDGLDQTPEVRATLLLRLGEVYSKLGDYPQATRLLTESIDLLRRLRNGDHRDVATALGNLSVVRYEAGDIEAAEARSRESLAMRQRLGDASDLIKPKNSLASILMKREKFAEAAAIYREGLARRRATVAASPTDPVARGNLATSLRNLATAHVALGDLDQAEVLLTEALTVRRALYGDDSTRVASVLLSLGRLEQVRGSLEAAETLIVRARDIRRDQLGADHAHTALAQRDVGAVRAARADWQGAHDPASEAVRVLRLHRPKDDPEVAKAEGILGAVLMEKVQLDEAEAYLRQSCETLGNGSPRAVVDALQPCERLARLRVSMEVPSSSGLPG